MELPLKAGPFTYREKLCFSQDGCRGVCTINFTIPPPFSESATMNVEESPKCKKAARTAFRSFPPVEGAVGFGESFSASTEHVGYGTADINVVRYNRETNVFPTDLCIPSRLHHGPYFYIESFDTQVFSEASSIVLTFTECLQRGEPSSQPG